jgi:hypothetical protein
VTLTDATVSCGPDTTGVESCAADAFAAYGIGGAEPDLERVLPRIAKYGLTARALHETEWRRLRERDTIGQSLGGRVIAQSTGVKRPQRLHLVTNIVGSCDLVRVGAVAHRTSGQFVSGG